MPIKTAIKRDNILLAKARKLFGRDKIKAAYVTVPYCGETKKELTQAFKTAEFIQDELAENILCFDNKTIWIQFKDERIIEFTSSEWASMSPVEINDTIKVVGGL